MGNLFDTLEHWILGLILLILIGWIIYRSLKYPQKTKKIIFGGICYFFLTIGGYSIFYWIYTLFVGGFDLVIFWYCTLIPLTIGSTVIPSILDEMIPSSQYKEVYPFWSTLKNRITTSGYLLIIWGTWEGIKGILDSHLMDRIDSFLFPIIIGLIPVLIDLYQQTDEDVS